MYPLWGFNHLLLFIFIYIVLSGIVFLLYHYHFLHLFTKYEVFTLPFTLFGLLVGMVLGSVPAAKATILIGIYDSLGIDHCKLLVDYICSFLSKHRYYISNREHNMIILHYHGQDWEKIFYEKNWYIKINRSSTGFLCVSAPKVLLKILNKRLLQDFKFNDK